jgi:hypothetical protein
MNKDRLKITDRPLRGSAKGGAGNVYVDSRAKSERLMRKTFSGME